jgi:hypothetical protein
MIQVSKGMRACLENSYYVAHAPSHASRASLLLLELTAGMHEPEAFKTSVVIRASLGPRGDFRLITVISICTYDTCICRKCMCVVVRGDYTHALHVVCACCDVSWIDQSRNVFMHVSTQTWTCNATGRTCNALRLACIALIIHTRCMLHCTCMQRV